MKKNAASIRSKSSVLSRTRKMAMMASALIPTLWLGLEQPGHAAAVLIHDYQFNGDFTDSLAGPALVPLNGTGTLSLTNYSFAAGQGLSLSSGLPSAGDYSIVADFSFASTSGYRKIVDFKTQTSDSGLYNLSTALNFFPVITGTAGAFAANVTASMALTRDGTSNQVTGYVNGVQQITFTDGSSLAVFTGANSEIRFFIDDEATSGSEASAGVVERIRIYNGALTAAEVNPSVPPATHWLGATNGTWTGANWASDAAGTPTAAIPTSTDDVTFSATGAANQGNTTLGQDFTIHSLTISDTMPVVIGSGLGGPFKLTISGNAGTGITVDTGANLTISANVTLAGSSNTIAVNGTGAAAISGVLDSSNLLTKTGAGTLTLTGANTFSGGMNLQQGMVSFADGSLGNTGTVEFTGSATLQWNGTNTQDISSRLYLEDGVNATFDTNGNNVTFANAFQLGDDAPTGTAAITKTGLGTLTMLAVNTYTGGTFINQGTLSFANGALGTEGTVDFTGSSTLQWNGTNTEDLSSRIKIEDGVNATFDTNGNNVTLATGLQVGTLKTAAVTKTGAGTLTVLAANTYTGGTTVSAGTLFLGNGTPTGASLGTGAVTVAGNATFQLNLADGVIFPNNVGNSGHIVADDAPTNNYTMSGVISGNGDFTKIGGNTVTLSGVNTYTGNTYVNGGTLLAGVGTPSGNGIAGADGPGPFGQNSAVFVNSGGILQLNGFNVSIAALLGNPGGIVQNSSVTPATLTLTGVDNFGFFNGILRDGPLVPVNQQQGRKPSNFVALTPAPLSLWMAGSGEQTLAGLNTYTGTTTVSSGILRAGVSNAGGVGATGPGAFGNNSAVTVNNTGILQLGGNDVGIGSLAGDANGIVENGGRQFTKQPSQLIARSLPATLTTGGNNTDTTFAGTIRDGVLNQSDRRPAGEKERPALTGPLAIYKTGTGTQTLSGNNSYTGGTTLAQGTLAAGSRKAFGNGNLTVTGGTLKTTGGPLAVDIGAGNILFSGGTYQAGVGGLLPAVQHDQLVTTGMANIGGGTLALIQLNSFHLMAGNRIILLSAAAGVAGGSANGTPVPGSHVTGLAAFSNTPLLVPVVNLYTTSVVLEAMQGSFVLSGLTPNQIAVAQALNSLAAITGGKTGVIKELDFLDNQSVARLPGFLDMISPEEMTLIFQLAKSLANVQSANIQGRLAEIRAELDQILSINSVNISIGGSRKVDKQAPPLDDERWGLWMIGSGEFTRVGSTSNAAGFDLDSGGVTAGVDYRFSDHFVAGISFGYMNTTASIANGGKVDVNGGRVGAYATWFNRNFYVDASVSGGPNSYNTRRTTPNNTTATANPGGTEVNLLLASGYDWKKGALTFGPIASFQYTNVQLDGFTETGGFAPLSVIRKNADSMRSAIGFRASYDIKVRRAIIRPEARVSWQHEFGDTSYSLTSNFATLGGNPFTVAGPETGRDSMLVRAGVSVQWTDRFSTSAYYDGELLRKNYSSNNVSLGFRWKF